MDTHNTTIPFSRRSLILAAAVTAGVLLLSFTVFAVCFQTQLNRIREACDSRMLAPVSVSSAVSLYTLREYEGRIGIFEAGEPEPVQILDVYLFTLPEADQLALRTGIRVYSSDALRSLIEDFTG